MVIKPQIKLFFSLTILLSSCATTNNWQEDDIYSMKEAAVPIDTDISDETDYSAYIYKKSLEDKKTVYSNNTSSNRIEPFAWRNRPMFSVYYGIGNPLGYSTFSYGPRWYLSPWGDVVYMDYGYNSYGNGLYGNPYFYGYNNYPYNYNNLYGNNGGNYGPWTGNATSTSVINRPRGSIGGMGGVSSRASQGSGQPVAAFVSTKPTTTSEQTRKPVSSTATIGRSSNGSPAISSRPNSNVTRPTVSSSTRTNSPSSVTPVRTSTTTGARVSSPTRSTNSSTSPSRSSSGTSSGRSTSGSSSSSKSPGRR